MADSKITALTAISTVDPAADPLVIVDVSDTSMAASGTTKKATINQLLGASGTATLASATITGDLTVDTNTLKVDSVNNRVGIRTASPAEPLTVDNTSGVTTGAIRIYATDQSHSRLAIQNINGQAYHLVAGNPGTSNAGFALYDNTAAATRWYVDNTGVQTWSNVGGVAGTAMTLNSTGLGVGVTPSASGGCLQLKSGITFPATQIASSDANTLDDYEEGTWTPSVGGTATYTTQTGRYVKIGNRVFITLRMTINTIGTGDDYRISGLPFQPAAVLAAASVGFFANLKISANFISGYASTASSVITMTGTTAASANITNGIGVFGNGSDIVMSCFYEI